jgi:DNA polymerase-3 subunit beta
MNIIVSRPALKQALAIVYRAVGSRPTLPVLSHVLIASDQGRLKLVCTDLHMAITHWIGASVLEGGAITVPAKLLTDVVAGLSSDKITLTTREERAELKLVCGRDTTTIRGFEGDEFPLIPRIATEPIATIPGTVLAEALAQVAFAAATDDSRPVLSGVRLRFCDDGLLLNAADGFRLADRKIPLEPSIYRTHGLEVIVIKSALRELPAIIDSDTPVQIRINKSQAQVWFSTEDTELIARVIDGLYPDVQRIIPTQYTTRAVIDTAALRQAVKLAKVFATTETASVVKLELCPSADGPGQLHLSARVEHGDNAGTVDAVISGPKGRIALNVRYLAEMLDCIDTPHVAIELQTEQAPLVIKPSGKTNNYTHVIMPMTWR